MNNVHLLTLQVPPYTSILVSMGDAHPDHYAPILDTLTTILSQFPLVGDYIHGVFVDDPGRLVVEDPASFLSKVDLKLGVLYLNPLYWREAPLQRVLRWPSPSSTIPHTCSVQEVIGLEAGRIVEQHIRKTITDPTILELLDCLTVNAFSNYLFKAPRMNPYKAIFSTVETMLPVERTPCADTPPSPFSVKEYTERYGFKVAYSRVRTLGAHNP